MITKIFKCYEIDLNKIDFSDKKNSYDNSFSYILLSYENNNIGIQTPKMINTNGILINNNGKFYLKLQNFNKNEILFNEFINMIDNYIIEYAFKNNINDTWGGSINDYKKKYVYSFKKDINTKEDYLLTKIQKNDDLGWFFEIYNTKKELIKKNDFNKDEIIKVILLCNGIWITKNNFGLIWSIGQMQLYDTKPIQGLSILDDDDIYDIF